MIRRNSAATPSIFLHSRRMIVDLASDGGHGDLGLLARGMIEATCDPRIIKVKIAGQGRRRPLRSC